MLGIGIGIKGGQPVSDIEEALVRILNGIKKHGKRVLVTVDDVSNSGEIQIFTSAYQIFLRYCRRSENRIRGQRGHKGQHLSGGRL